MILSANIVVADPPRLPLPDHIYRLVSRACSPRGVEGAKALLGLHARLIARWFCSRMLSNIEPVDVGRAAQSSFPPHSCNRRAAEAGFFGVDDARLRMQWIAKRLAE
jgi:hypothetical protein